MFSIMNVIKLKKSGVLPNCFGKHPNKSLTTGEQICHSECTDDQVHQCIDYTYHN